MIIAHVDDDNVLALSTNQKTNNRGATTDVTLNEDGTLQPGSEVQLITLEEEDGCFLFNVGEGYLYAASSSSNYLRTIAEPDDNAKATITITSDGEAKIVFQGLNTRNVMRYNPNNGTPLFSCYASTSTAGSLPSIYRALPNEDTPTSVNRMDGQWTKHNKVVYDLSGRRLSALPQRGVYIVDGKKKVTR